MTYGNSIREGENDWMNEYQRSMQPKIHPLDMLLSMVNRGRWRPPMGAQSIAGMIGLGQPNYPVSGMPYMMNQQGPPAPWKTDVAPPEIIDLLAGGRTTTPKLPVPGVAMSPDSGGNPKEPSYTGLLGPLLDSSLADYNKAAGQKVEAPKVQQPFGRGDLLWALLAAGLPALFAGPRGSRKARAAMEGLQSFIQMKRMLADKATEQNMAAYKAALEERQAAIDKAKVNIGMDQFKLGQAADNERLDKNLNWQREQAIMGIDADNLRQAAAIKAAQEGKVEDRATKLAVAQQRFELRMLDKLGTRAMDVADPERRKAAMEAIAEMEKNHEIDPDQVDELARAAGYQTYRQLRDEASARASNANANRTNTLLPLEVAGKKADIRLKNTRADLALKELAAFDSKTAADLAGKYARIEQGYMRITQADARNQTTVAKNQATEVSKYVESLRMLKKDAQAGIEKTSKELNDMVAANSNAALMNVSNPNAKPPYSEADIQAAKDALSAYRTQLKAASEAYTGAREDYDRVYKSSQGSKPADTARWRDLYSRAPADKRKLMEDAWRTAHPLEPFPWTK